jgi:hypothetical protein
MKKLVTVRSLADTNTLTMTNIFPAITMILMRPNIITDTMTVASLNFMAMLVHMAPEDVLLVGNSNWFLLSLRNGSIWSLET